VNAKRAWFEKIGYVPHRQQLLYHDSQARFRIPVCGRRFGKSTMAGRDLEPHLFTRGKRFWIVGPTYDLAEKEFRVIWDDLIIKLKLGRDKRVKKAYNKRVGDMYIELPWQTRVETRSADHPEFLVGEALDGAIMSEAAKQKKETWERFIRPSLADKRGWATFPTTPEGFNWLHDLWQLGANPNFPDFESWKFPSWANNVVYPGGRTDPEILLLEQTTTPEWFEQEIGADFSSFVGKIFVEWDEFVHVRPHTFNPNWPNYMAFDWGFTNPLAAIEFQVSPQDTIHIWREHYKPYMTLENHIQELKGRPNPPGYRLDMAFGDAADPEAAMYVSQHLVGCIADPDAKKKEMWGVGINLMNNFMKQNREKRSPEGLIISAVDEFGTPQYDAGYFIDPTCTNTIKEHNNYRSPEPIKGKNVPELGQKISDHTIDAIRYALVQLYHLGVNHHLIEVYGAGVNGPLAQKVEHSEFRAITPGSFDESQILARGIFSTKKDF
jgi:hypothetical protein